MANNELTVSSVSDLFLRAYIAPNTASTYGRALQTYLSWLADRNPFEPDPKQALAYAIEYRDHIMSEYSKSTASSYVSAIKAFYKMAKGLGAIQLNVWEMVKVPTPPSISSTRALDHHQLVAAHGSAEALGSRDLLIFRLLYEAALRREEVSSLPADALELTADGYALKIVGKGDKTAMVGISDDLAHAIQKQILDNPKGCKHVFPGYKDGPINPRHINFILDKIDPNIHPHQLRHTHATEAIEGGSDVVDVSRTLRHSSIQTTMRYIDRRNSVTKSTARLIGRKLKCEKVSEPESAPQS